MVLERDIAAAMDRGHCSVREAEGWPKYVWGRSLFRRNGAESIKVVWEARCTGDADGSYKAYPVQKGRHASQMPAAVEEFLWP